MWCVDVCSVKGDSELNCSQAPLSGLGYCLLNVAGRYMWLPLSMGGHRELHFISTVLLFWFSEAHVFQPCPVLYGRQLVGMGNLNRHTRLCNQLGYVIRPPLTVYHPPDHYTQVSQVSLIRPPLYTLLDSYGWTKSVLIGGSGVKSIQMAPPSLYRGGHISDPLNSANWLGPS